jgi:hypothetical protein
MFLKSLKGMAAARRAVWVDATWGAAIEDMVERPPSHMFLLSLRAQAAALTDVTRLTVDAIIDGLEAYEEHRQVILAEEG